MIKVKKKLVHFSDSEDAFGIMEAIVNQLIAGTAEAIEDEVDGIKCCEHPNQDTVISVTGNHPDSGKMVSMEVTRYCCQDFKNAIKLTVN